MDDDQLVRAAKAIGDASRFKLLNLLAESGEVAVGELAASVGVSQPTASHHLKTLADCGLVTVRHAGQHSYFAVEADVVEQLCSELRTRLGGQFRLPDLGWGVID